MKYKVTHLQLPLGEVTDRIEEYINKLESEGWKLVSFAAATAIYYVFIWEKA